MFLVVAFISYAYLPTTVNLNIYSGLQFSNVSNENFFYLFLGLMFLGNFIVYLVSFLLKYLPHSSILIPNKKIHFSSNFSIKKSIENLGNWIKGMGIFVNIILIFTISLIYNANIFEGSMNFKWLIYSLYILIPGWFILLFLAFPKQKVE